MQLFCYITFTGNCRAAMTFYKNCLGGELIFQTLGESPNGQQMPHRMKNLIVHSKLSNKGLILMGSDLTPETGLVKGNTISFMLDCSSEIVIKKTFKKLSIGGTINHPLENTFQGNLIGNLTDKYGNNWILNFHKNKH